MENERVNKVVIQVFFGVLLVVPLVIGISLYSRPVNLTPSPIVPTPTPYPTPYVYPTPSQYRYYVSGWAFDQSTAAAISANFVDQNGDTYPITNGYFYFPVSPSTTFVSFYITGYKPKSITVGADSPGMAFSQDLGNLYFEKEQPLNKPVEEVTAPKGWLVYKNQKFNYSVFYPENWTYGENLTGGGYTYGSLNFVDSPNGLPIVGLVNYQDATSSSLEDYVNSYLKNQTVKIKKTYLTLDGKSAIQLEISSTNYIVTYMKRQSDNQVFQWDLWQNTSENRKIYNQLLATFKY